MSEGKQMQADLLAQLERQLAAANARVEELETALASLERWADGNQFRSDCQTVTHLRERMDRAEAKLAACRGAGFVDEKGEVVKYEKQYWPADCDGDSCQDLEDIADSCEDGEMLEVIPILILPRELYVVSVDARGVGETRPANDEEKALHEKSEQEWRERAKVLPKAAEAARGGGGR